jgi:hypothetical protein
MVPPFILSIPPPTYPHSNLIIHPSSSQQWQLESVRTHALQMRRLPALLIARLHGRGVVVRYCPICFDQKSTPACIQRLAAMFPVESPPWTLSIYNSVALCIRLLHRFVPGNNNKRSNPVSYIISRDTCWSRSKHQ